MSSNCVYKYVDKQTNEVLYVGKTTRLNKRIKQHKYEYYFSNHEEDLAIYWCRCKNAGHMNLLEAYLIDKYQPKLNTLLKCGDSLNIEMPEPEWRLYDEKCVTQKQDKPRKKPQKKSAHIQNKSFYKERLERIRNLCHYIQAIPYFYRRFKRATQSNNIIVIPNVYDETTIKQEWDKYYFSYSWNNNKCKESNRCSLTDYYLDEINNKLILIINKSLYKSQLYYRPKYVLRKIRERYKREIDKIIKEIQDNYEGFEVYENNLLEWKDYFSLVKST